MTSPFAHRSGLPGTYDLTPLRPDHSSLVFSDGPGDSFLFGSDLNAMQSIMQGRITRTGNMTARDGDRLDGAAIVIDRDTGAVSLADGRVYVQGDVHAVTAASFTGVPMTGDVRVGVRLTSTWVTSDDDTDLVGLEPGYGLADGHGEPAAAREVRSIAWGWDGDGDSLDTFYPVYLIKDGTAIDQTPPPSLSGVNAQIAIYDRDAHGHYVVQGCEVTALGKTSGAQVFSIAAGVANIGGYKRTRLADIRLTVPEEPDLDLIEAELRTWVGSAPTCMFAVHHAPIAAFVSVQIEKETTDTVTHGALSGAADALSKSSVKTLVEVKQGATVYVQGTDFILNADRVDWSMAGAEPASGSSYTVKYRYIDAVALTTGYTFTATHVTAIGGVEGGEVRLAYTRKLPRTDLVCLNDAGAAVYVKGMPAKVSPMAPLTPSTLLRLAEIRNDWFGTPEVRMRRVPRSITFEDLVNVISFMYDSRDLINLLKIEARRDSRDPVQKLDSFVDPLIDDYYRDQGVVQSAAVFGGTLQLAIDPTVFDFALNGPLMLDYEDEVIIDQPQWSYCQRINMFQPTDLVPAALHLLPPNDFWSEFNTVWTSPVTRVMTGGDSEEVVSTTDTTLPFLRQIELAFTIDGFLANETLTSLEFDGLSVLPAGPLVADTNGRVAGTFTIPTGVLAGSKQVAGKGNGGSKATTTWVGQGTRRDTTRRVVIAVQAERPTSAQANQGASSLDPVSQSNVMTAGRFIVALDIRFCVVGDRRNAVVIDMVACDAAGFPTQSVMGQSVVDMTGVVVGELTRCRLITPVWVPAGTKFAWVLKTNDMIHGVSAAKLGDMDLGATGRIAQQPYIAGEMGLSSNASAFQIMHDRDLNFRTIAARFTQTEKDFTFGTFTVTDMSDLLIPADLDIPTEDATFRWEIVRQSGEVIRVAPGQPVQFNEYITETLTLRAVLGGTETVSPVLYPAVQAIAGKIRQQGTYVTRAMAMGAAVRVASYIKALLPSGSSMVVECDAADNNFVAMTIPEGGVEALEDGWMQMRHHKTGFTAATGRLRFTIAGGPAARPALSDLTAYIAPT